MLRLTIPLVLAAGPALAASQPADDNALRATGPQPVKADKRFKLRFYLFRRD